MVGDYLYLKLGVYVVKVEIEGVVGGMYDGVVNFGMCFIFDKSDILLEVYVFDFD